MSDRLSLQVSRALDDLGFSEEMRQFRIDRYSVDNFVESLCSDRSVAQIVLAGSKAEGTSNFNQSDFDFLLVPTDVKATENTNIQLHDTDLILYMDASSAPPGYCTLELLQCLTWNFWNRRFLANDCYVYQHGTRYKLSSIAVVGVAHRGMIENALDSHLPPAGPSAPIQEEGKVDKDTVQAIKCTKFPNSLQIWFTRDRQHGWPTPELLQQISQSSFYVVPVGMHGSENKDLEWRISFNIAEKLLIHSFNTTQYKVYVLLKILMKEIVLRLHEKSITSYMVKTMMLWSIEGSSKQSWTEPNMLYNFQSVLLRLRQCVEKGECPNYFVPENNLLYGKLTPATQLRTYDLLTTMLCEGGSCVLRCPQIQQKINAYIFRSIGMYESDEKNIKEKYKIQLNLVRTVNLRCGAITNEMLDSNNAPATSFLSDLISTASCTDREQKDIVKLVIRKLLSNYAFHNLSRENSEQTMYRNIAVYSSIRRSLITSWCNSDTDVMSGKVMFANMLHNIGRVTMAQNVLSNALSSLKYYTFSCNRGVMLKGIRRIPQLENLIRHCTMRTVQIAKCFTAWEMRYEPSQQGGMLKALQFEVYRKCNKGTNVQLDSELLAYYLQYVCYKELGKTTYADETFLNMVWCAQEQDNKIEYKVVLNILGYVCLEKKQYNKALYCFVKSVQLTRKFPKDKTLHYNAAIIHIAVLLNKVRRQMAI